MAQGQFYPARRHYRSLSLPCQFFVGQAEVVCCFLELKVQYRSRSILYDLIYLDADFLDC